MRKMLSAILPLFLSISLFAQQKTEIPFESLVEAPFITSGVTFWNNQLIVKRKHIYVSDPRYPKYYFLDANTETFKPLVIAENDSIMGLAENTSTCFALVKRDGNTVLLMKDKKVQDRWVEDIPPNSSSITDHIKMFVSDNQILLLDYHYWLRDLDKKNWHFDYYDGFEGYVQKVGSCIYGANLSCKPWLGSRFSKCTIKNGHIIEDEEFEIPEGVELDAYQIIASTADSKGNLWLGQKIWQNSPQGGYTHNKEDSLERKNPDEPIFFDKEEPRIFSYDGKSFQPHYWYESIPQPMTNKEGYHGGMINSFFVDGKDNLYFASWYYGIFRISEGKVENIINTSLVAPRDSDKYYSKPDGMYINQKGDIYLSHSGLGLLAFHKKGNDYDLKQYLFEE